MGKSDPRLSTLMGLAPFERFVFVMSVLEGYSDQECSILLDCTRKDVAEARIRALQQAAGPEQKSIDPRASSVNDSATSRNLKKAVDLDLIEPNA
jgi:DNA-directed RNA polymerase specialized sigma24 family protein